MKAEFKTGYTVHFQNYTDRRIKAKVIEVNNPSKFFAESVDYRLEGIDQPLVSITTGKSIEESRLFSPVAPEDAFKD